MADPRTKLELLASAVQVVCVVSGVLIRVPGFNSARLKEAEARQVEAERPFLELGRKPCLDAVKTAAVPSTPEGRSKEELANGKCQLRELCVAELTVVEGEKVEQEMVSLAAAVDPDLRSLIKASQLHWSWPRHAVTVFLCTGSIELRQRAWSEHGVSLVFTMKPNLVQHFGE